MIELLNIDIIGIQCKECDGVGIQTTNGYEKNEEYLCPACSGTGIERLEKDV